jgi:hypothetical protein
MDTRALLVGIFFAGPGICVNIRQLQFFMAHSKSSLNGSFQQIGFTSVKAKSKARDFVLAALPFLQRDQFLLKQWTVRYNPNPEVWFESSFPHEQLPDLFPDQAPVARKPVQQFISPVQTPDSSGMMVQIMKREFVTGDFSGEPPNEVSLPVTGLHSPNKRSSRSPAEGVPIFPKIDWSIFDRGDDDLYSDE